MPKPSLVDMVNYDSNYDSNFYFENHNVSVQLKYMLSTVKYLTIQPLHCYHKLSSSTFRMYSFSKTLLFLGTMLIKISQHNRVPLLGLWASLVIQVSPTFSKQSISVKLCQPKCFKAKKHLCIENLGSIPRPPKITYQIIPNMVNYIQFYAKYNTLTFSFRLF